MFLMHLAKVLLVLPHHNTSLSNTLINSLLLHGCLIPQQSILGKNMLKNICCHFLLQFFLPWFCQFFRGRDNYRFWITIIQGSNYLRIDQTIVHCFYMHVQLIFFNFMSLHCIRNIARLVHGKIAH